MNNAMRMQELMGEKHSVMPTGSSIMTRDGHAIEKLARVRKRVPALRSVHDSTARKRQWRLDDEASFIKELSQEAESVRKQDPKKKLDDFYANTQDFVDEKKKKVNFKRQVAQQETRYGARVEKFRGEERARKQREKVFKQDLESGKESAERMEWEAKDREEKELQESRKKKWVRLNDRIICHPVFKKKTKEYLPAFEIVPTYNGERDGDYESLLPVEEYFKRELTPKQAKAATALLEFEYKDVSQLRTEWRNAGHKISKHLLDGKAIAKQIRTQLDITPIKDFVFTELYDLAARTVFLQLMVYETVRKLRKWWPKLEEHVKKECGYEAADRISTSWVFHMDDPPDRHAWGGKGDTPQTGMSLLGGMQMMSKMKKWGKGAAEVVQTKTKKEHQKWDAAIQNHVEKRIREQVSLRRASRVRLNNMSDGAKGRAKAMGLENVEPKQHGAMRIDL
jgi:hypothetical protein